MPYIYKITNDINQKVYIGKTLGTIEGRWKQHCNDYKSRNKEKRPLYSAMKKYGIEHFIIEEIEECSIDDVNEREQFWIKEYNSYHFGYNATLGGDGKHYADYDEIFKVFQTAKTLKETAKITGYDIDTVRKAVIFHNGKILSGTEIGVKLVAMIDSQTNEIIQIFPSIRKAEEFLGITYKSHISQVCQGKRKTFKGYKWKYTEE